MGTEGTVDRVDRLIERGRDNGGIGRVGFLSCWSEMGRGGRVGRDGFPICWTERGRGGLVTEVIGDPPESDKEADDGGGPCISDIPGCNNGRVAKILPLQLAAFSID